MLCVLVSTGGAATSIRHPSSQTNRLSLVLQTGLMDPMERPRHSPHVLPNCRLQGECSQRRLRYGTPNIPQPPCHATLSGEVAPGRFGCHLPCPNTPGEAGCMSRSGRLPCMLCRIEHALGTLPADLRVRARQGVAFDAAQPAPRSQHRGSLRSLLGGLRALPASGKGF
jgi:hypothetical protein